MVIVLLEKDLIKIGNKLYEARKRSGYTQAQAAEAAEISDRTYADIERGTVNMRVETLISICSALKLTPDEILTENDNSGTNSEERITYLLNRLSGCSENEKRRR